jgi:hypothetical protein
MTGTAVFTSECPPTEAELGRAIALIGGGDASLLRERNSGHPSFVAKVPGPCFTPALESMLERFIRDRRRVRPVSVPIPLSLVE